LAGLILDDERKNASKLPGLGDIPLLGRLFSNQEDKKSKTEIVLAITPRIIGNLNLPQAEIVEYWSGTESLISDKPQVSLPAVIAPLSRQDQIKEQAKLRRTQMNSEVTTEPSSTEEPVSSPPIVEIPEVPPVIDQTPPSLAP